MPNSSLPQVGAVNDLRDLLRRRGWRAPDAHATAPTEPFRKGDLRGLELVLSRGFAPGGVSEWVSLQEGSGAMELALSLACQRLPEEGRWLIADRTGEISPIALERMGLNLSRIAFVRPREQGDALWVIEQALRSRGIDVVFCHLSKLTPVVFRRLKLAAETGGSRCLLMRGADALREASWADIRLLVSPLFSPHWEIRRLRMEVLKIRNALPGKAILVELDHETNAVRVVSELADSAGLQRAAGA
jgi:hypothetical protein